VFLKIHSIFILFSHTITLCKLNHVNVTEGEVSRPYNVSYILQNKVSYSSSNTSYSYLCSMKSSGAEVCEYVLIISCVHPPL
jgi:hypothetical protein